MSCAPVSRDGRWAGAIQYTAPASLRGHHVHLQRPQTRDDSSEQNDEPPSPPQGTETSRVGLIAVTGRGKGAGDGALVQPDRALPDPLRRGARRHHPRPERRAALPGTRSVMWQPGTSGVSSKYKYTRPSNSDTLAWIPLTQYSQPSSPKKSSSGWREAAGCRPINNRRR
jgi:hypothetical protein